jgi:D-glycero-alpha-D-manno-heptose-7-phosphate kinase
VRAARAVARCRVDFAGGTLDIWPLGLLHPGASTVNVAIDLAVSAAITPRAAGWSLAADGEPARDFATLEVMAADPRAALVGIVARELDLGPCAIETASASPRGAGLGASSALTVALLAAIEAARGLPAADALSRARLARDLEARLMGLPTGLQDHLPAQLGGALALEHRAGGETVRRLDVGLEALAERLLVAYTGQSHFSAGANWRVIRARLEGEERTVAALDAIRDVAASLPTALERADWEAAGRLVAREWRARRTLSEAVSTPQLESLLETAERLGAWGGKACGAGGGGCVAVLAPPAAREPIFRAWRESGATPLPGARPTHLGLELTS